MPRKTLILVLLFLVGVAGVRVSPVDGAISRWALSEHCGSEGVDLTLMWDGYVDDVVEQWADLSILDNGFATGTFTALGPMRRDVDAMTWMGATPNAIYYGRIHQRLQNGSVFSTPTILI